jgi:hypothetical protein
MELRGVTTLLFEYLAKSLNGYRSTDEHELRGMMRIQQGQQSCLKFGEMQIAVAMNAVMGGGQSQMFQSPKRF